MKLNIITRVQTPFWKVLFLLLAFSGLAQAQSGEESVMRHYSIIPSGEGGSADTLFVEKSDAMMEYWVIWRGDTLTKAWSYSPISEIVSSLGVFGYTRAYLIQAYHGDGCPVVYQALLIKEDDTAFISDYFGNCNEISEMRMAWPIIQFSFQGMKEANRKPVSYIFNAQVGSFKQK